MAVSIGPREIKALRGAELRCKSWRAEAILRMLENNLENAEAPEDLVVYAGSARAARSWPDFDRIVRALRDLEEHETLVCQSGRAVGRFTTHRLAPMVVMANQALVDVDRSSFPPYLDTLNDYVAKGLAIWGGMTAGAWQYIGSQGILQGTYETFMAVGRKRFGGSLAGRMILTAGLGGMGGAQALAGYLAGAATLIVEADARRVDRRVREGYCRQRVDDLDEALRLVLEAKQRREPISVGLVGNVADVMPKLLERGIVPDVVTDQTSVDFLRGYIPLGMTPAEVAAQRESGDVAVLYERGRETIAIHMRAMLEFGRRGAEIFEYGNGLRSQAQLAGVADAFEMGGFIEDYIRPLFCEGFGPFRWVAISGEPDDILAIDDLILEHFPGHSVTSWIAKAREHVRFTGLPARIGWMGHGDRHRLGLLVNEAIRDGRIAGPISFTRDHLDSGSVTSPFRETENMRDGSDGIGDWPLLNGLLNAASHADLVALHGFGDSAGVTTVADGTEPAVARLTRVLSNDPGLGVLRHADAGYEAAVSTAAGKRLGLRVPRRGGRTVADPGRDVVAGRGSELRCKGWRQEALLRMLENTLENAEAPERLIVHGGAAQAARDWESFDAIAANLRELEEDETLVVQSGKPIGIFATHRRAPMVVVASGAVSGPDQGRDGLRGLVDAGLSAYGGTSAGSWQYVGPQSGLAATHERFMAIARRRFGGRLAGRLLVTAGCGGMAGAQALAGRLAGAAVLVADVRADRIGQRMREGGLERRADSIDEALALALAAREGRRPASIGVVTNAVELLEELLRRELVPDIVTSATATDPAGGYVPVGMTPQDAADLRTCGEHVELRRRGQETAARHVRAMLALGGLGAEAFEQGGGLRSLAAAAGVSEAHALGGFVDADLREQLAEGAGPLTWIAISGDPADIDAIDALVEERFAGGPLAGWIEAVRGQVGFTGLPARSAWLRYEERAPLGRLIDEAVRDRRVKGPVAFVRDQLGAGAIAAPLHETERMRDGSDKIADWPLANALLNVAGDADLVTLALHGGGSAGSAGVTVIADGTDAGSERVGAMLRNDAGLGMLRYADAGYPAAAAAAERFGLGIGG